jgi:hypothetical protein
LCGPVRAGKEIANGNDFQGEDDPAVTCAWLRTETRETPPRILPRRVGHMKPPRYPIFDLGFLALVVP